MWNGYEDTVGTEHLDECDCCGDIFPITVLIYNGIQFLCPKCISSCNSGAE